MPASFIKRIGAYLIDIIIVVIVSSLITSFIPNKKLNDLSYEYNKYILESYENYNSDELDLDEVNKKLDDYTYLINKASIGSNLILISTYFLYFIVLNRYNSGQTVGKKLLNIEIVDYEGNTPNMKQLCIRGIILYPMVFDLLRVILILLLSKSLYLSVAPVLSLIRIIIFVVCCISIMIGSGVHDKLSGTMVVLYKSMNEEDNKATKWKKKNEREKEIKIYKNNHTSGKRREDKNERINRTRIS